MIEMQEAHELHASRPTNAHGQQDEHVPSSSPTASIERPSMQRDATEVGKQRPASTGPASNASAAEQDKELETKSHPSGSPTTLSFLPSDFTIAQPFKYPSVTEQSYDTLDEPVRQTLERDLRAIWNKLTLVLHPKIQKSNALKDWDLWGPLILCLSLAV